MIETGELVFATLVLSLLAIVGAIVALVLQRIADPLAPDASPVDPIVGPKDRIAIYDTGGPYIAMPERLKTQQEMVDWMTKELPKLTAEKGRAGS